MTALAFPKARRVIDRVHLARVRRLPCCACQATSDIQAHHMTGSGLALKADDHQAMPLCRECHRQFHDGRGVFASWSKAQRKDWQESCVRVTSARLATEAF